MARASGIEEGSLIFVMAREVTNDDLRDDVSTFLDGIDALGGDNGSNNEAYQGEGALDEASGLTIRFEGCGASDLDDAY